MAEQGAKKFRLCVDAALKKKALDLLALDIRQSSSFADFFIICSGTSNRQVQAIAHSIEMELKKQGIYPLGIEGFAIGTHRHGVSAIQTSNAFLHLNKAQKRLRRYWKPDKAQNYANRHG